MENSLKLQKYQMMDVKENVRQCYLFSNFWDQCRYLSLLIDFNLKMNLMRMTAAITNHTKHLIALIKNVSTVRKNSTQLTKI